MNLGTTGEDYPYSIDLATVESFLFSGHRTKHLININVLVVMSETSHKYRRSVSKSNWNVNST